MLLCRPYIFLGNKTFVLLYFLIVIIFLGGGVFQRYYVTIYGSMLQQFEFPPCPLPTSQKGEKNVIPQI